MAEFVHRLCPPMELAPGVRKAARQAFGQQVGQQGARARVLEQPVFGIDAWQQIERHRLPAVVGVGLGLPVVRHLQDGRAGQAAVRDQCGLAEHRAAAVCFHLEREPRQRRESRQGFGRQGQRHQCRPRCDHRKAELRRQLVAQRAGADFGNRQATSGNDQAMCAEATDAGIDHVACALRVFCLRCGHGQHLRRHRPVDAAVIALGAQHVDDLLRRVVAEQLAPIPFVEGDAVTLHELDEVRRGVARQGGADKVRVAAEEVFRADATIGEVAPATARNADLFGELFGMIDQQHATPTLAGGGGAHHAGRARADDQHIVVPRTGWRSRRGWVRHVST